MQLYTSQFDVSYLQGCQIPLILTGEITKDALEFGLSH